MAASTTSYQIDSLSKIGESLSNPFPGLRPFGPEESHLFFGREGQSDEILLKLAQNRFSALLGFSGSGKSSLIYCGLIPTLLGGFMTEAGSLWRIVILRPGMDPISNLAEALVSREDRAEALTMEQKVVRKTLFSAILRSSSLGLVEVVQRMRSAKQENILIIVDQFEEIFRYKKVEQGVSGSDESALFVSLLVESIRSLQVPVYVTLTMRSDFIGECSAFPELTQMINDSHYLIPQMNREQKRKAIEGPVAVGDGKIAPRLVQQLLNDVGESPHQLPVLQHALMRTWRYWQENRRAKEPMDLQHYNAIGTLKEALSQHANEAYDSLDKREQRVCEVLFKAITEKGTEEQGVRRPTKLSLLASIAGVNEDDIIRVVNKFREPGRSLLMPPADVPLEQDTVIDISHESLMRIWTRLGSWVEEEAKAADMYRKLAEAAERYQAGITGLWKMPDLQLALNWKQENKPTLVWGRRYHPAYERVMVFLETSRRVHQTEQRNQERLQKRKVRRNRIVAVIGSVVGLACIFIAYIANIKAEEAERSATVAKEQEVIAREAGVKAQEEADKARIAERKAEAAAASAQREKVAAEAARDEAKASEAKAEERRIEAETATKTAKEAQVTAERAEKNANVQKERAVLAKEDADRLRYQAIAQSMASKVEDLTDPEQKALIGLQAYSFYDEYSTKQYNPDVYDGVYHAYEAVFGDDVNKWEGHEGNVRQVVFSPAGDRVYSASSDGKVYAWRLGDSHKQYSLILDLTIEEVVLRVLLPLAGDRLVVAGDLGDIFVVSTAKKGILQRLKAPSDVIYDMVLLPGGKEYVSVGNNGLVMRGSLTSDTYEVVGQGDGAKLKRLSLEPVGGHLLAGSDEAGNIFVWDMQGGERRMLHTLHTGKPVHALAFSPDGKYLASGDETGRLILWDMANDVPYAEFNAHASRINDVSFSQEKTLMATASWDNKVKVWDLSHINDLPIVLDDHDEWVFSASFSPDGSQLATASADKSVRLWPMLAGEMAQGICGHEVVNRNMSQKEWKQFVSEDVPYRATCKSLPSGEDE